MKKIITIALKDLNVLLKDNASLFWVLGFPVLYALLFGLVLSDIGSGSGPVEIKLVVVDDDKTAISEQFALALAAEENLNVERLDEEEAMSRVRTGKLGAAIFIREGFGDSLADFGSSSDDKLEIAIDPSRKMLSGFLQGSLVRVRIKMLFREFTDPERLSNRIDKWYGEISNSSDLSLEQILAVETVFESLKGFVSKMAMSDHLESFFESAYEIKTIDVSHNHKNNRPATAFQVTCPQAMIWAVLTCTLTFAVSIVKERERGTYQRLIAGQVSRLELLIGKAVACCISSMLVLALLIVLAMLIFKMPVNNFLILTIAGFCSVFSFVGIMTFASTLCKTERAVTGAAWAVIMVMAMFGGAMVPMLFMPSWMQTASGISVVKWSIMALEGGIWRNFSYAELMEPCGILIGIGLIFFFLGFTQLKRAEA
ncbi:MAG: ABC transporter permease [Phycisphaerae bacterium]|jgi:ABC-2 type transport system permease protein